MPKLVDHARQCRELAATAADVVASDGLEHATLRSVAARHGCTKGMVQHYFTDKNSLLLGALDYVEAQTDARMPGADPTLQGLELVHARLACLLPVSVSARREWQVRLAFNNLASLSPAMKTSMARRRDSRQRAVINGLRQARRAGELNNPRSLINTSRALDALVSGIGFGSVVDPGAYPAVAQRRILRVAIDDLRR